MKTDIWMPLYINDYKGATDDLDAEESGIYLHLIMKCWTDGSLPTDKKRLMRIAKIYDSDKYPSIEMILDRFFMLGEDGWRNKRVDDERCKVEDKSNKARESASAKWGNLSNGEKRSQRLSEARKKGTHTPDEWAAMKGAFPACLICGSLDSIVKDHIVPLYQGGSDSINNIQPLCRSCNSSKGPESTDHRPEGWESLLGLFDVCVTPAKSVLSESESQSESYKEKDSICSNDFETFYSAYPRKVGKEKARASFKRHYSKLPGIDALVTIVNKWAATDDWTKDNRQFAPHPTTWLNRGGWEDEIQPTNTQSTPTPQNQPQYCMKHGAAGYRLDDDGACPYCKELGE